MLCGMYSPQTWGWAGHEELQLSVFSLGPDSVKGGRHVQCDRIWEGRGKGKGGGGGGKDPPIFWGIMLLFFGANNFRAQVVIDVANFAKTENGHETGPQGTDFSLDP